MRPLLSKAELCNTVLVCRWAVASAENNGAPDGGSATCGNVANDAADDGVDDAADAADDGDVQGREAGDILRAPGRPLHPLQEQLEVVPRSACVVCCLWSVV